ncbi:hypothetical protein N7527_005465 [Penicillium freii]|nr:hypothetical protein N7527_005465 [Penicillium freii]
MSLYARPIGLFKSSLRSFSISTRILAPLESRYLGSTDNSQFSNRPKAQNPTVLRLGEVLSVWLPDTLQGQYDQYLQTLSPAYNHLLTYSQYNHYNSQISLLSSPVFVMNIGNNDRVTDHCQYNGIDPESIEALESHLSSAKLDSGDRPPARIIYPNIFSHHIGTSFKDIEKSIGIYKLCNTKIEAIPLSISTFEHKKNLQILKSHLGRLSIANIEVNLSHFLWICHERYTYRDINPRTIEHSLLEEVYVQGF